MQRIWKRTVNLRPTRRVLGIVLHRYKLGHALYLGADLFFADHSLQRCAAPFRSNFMSKLTLFGHPAASLRTYFQQLSSDNNHRVVFLRDSTSFSIVA